MQPADVRSREGCMSRWRHSAEFVVSFLAHRRGAEGQLGTKYAERLGPVQRRRRSWEAGCSGSRISTAEKVKVMGVGHSDFPWHSIADFVARCSILHQPEHGLYVAATLLSRLQSISHGVHGRVVVSTQSDVSF
jgi:hypothetical protein